MLEEVAPAKAASSPVFRRQFLEDLSTPLPGAWNRPNLGSDAAHSALPVEQPPEPAMSLHFQKMHANGDDFVIVDLRGQTNIIDRDIARRLGDRNRGIGFNQLAVMTDCEDAAARLTFWNPDGSTLDACGSATRGVAWMIFEETKSASTILRTNRGLLACTREPNGAIVSRNAEVEETGLGAGVLNQPARGIAWLANRLAEYGQGIEAGQIVLAGSFIRPIEARHGDTIVADFGPYGTVSTYFA